MTDFPKITFLGAGQIAEALTRGMLAAGLVGPEQIMAAPDCGLVKLDVPTARAKLQAMAAGARMARERI